MGTLPDLQTLIRATRRRGGSAPLERLRHAVSISEELAALGDAVVDHCVEDARQRGHSWSEIGKVLGMTKQAAQQKFRTRWFDRFSRHRARACVGFTQRAHHSVELAREEARSLEHDYVGTEHLLLGLLRASDGVAAKALSSLEPGLETTIRRKVEDRIGRGVSSGPGPLPFTPRAKKALQLARDEATSLGHNYIGTEHILLALAGLTDGLAAEMLAESGITLDRARAVVVGLLAKEAS